MVSRRLADRVLSRELGLERPRWPDREIIVWRRVCRSTMARTAAAP
jgi:hypothetical protein